MMRDLLRLDPFRDIGGLTSFEGGNAFIPSVEVKETRDSYVFRADLPGMKEDEVDIALTGNRLTISGERKSEKKEEDERFYAYERSYGSFSRSFTLPEGADADHAQAELKNGVLSIVLPKRPEVKARRISLGKREDKKLQA
jgi:HSP20 family protein